MMKAEDWRPQNPYSDKRSRNIQRCIYEETVTDTLRLVRDILEGYLFPFTLPGKPPYIMTPDELWQSLNEACGEEAKDE